MDAREEISKHEFIKLQNGDSRVFKKVYDLYFGLVCHVVSRCGIGSDDALDVVHDTFFTLYKKGKSIQSCEGLKSWLLTTARNLSLDRLRRIKMHQKYQISQQVLMEEAVVDSVISREQLHELELFLLGELIEMQRRDSKDDTFWLFYREGMSAKQIADKRGEPISTVTNRLSRLRNRFRERFARHLTTLRESVY